MAPIFVKDVRADLQRQYPHRSAATPPTCDKDCKSCNDQYAPASLRHVPSGAMATAMHDDTEATSNIAHFLTTTRKNLAIVRGAISSHGNTLAHRWLKKTSAQRAKMLLRAKPNIHEKECAWVELEDKMTHEVHHMAKRVAGGQVFGHDEVNAARSPERHETFLLPYVDQESLSKEPMRLLALMHHRSHSQPSEWMLFDRQHVQHSFHSCLFYTAYNPHAVVAYGDQIGQLTQWQAPANHKWD